MTNRTLITVTGGDRVDFLQGLISNDVSRMGADPIYAALLTPQGKYLADFFVWAQDEALILDVDPSLGPALAQRLGMYKLRADVTLSTRETVVSRGLGTPQGDARPDPRAPRDRLARPDRRLTQ